MSNSTPLTAYQKTSGMLYFARMLDKIRLHHHQQLREDFHQNLGKGFDERCLDYLRISYAALQKRVLEGGSDEEILEWCFQTGRQLNESDIFIWNQFISKAGWNDLTTPILERRKKENGLENRAGISTMLEFFEFDEGRK